MRVCKKCGLSKNIEEFPVHECGRRYACRTCYNKARQAKIMSNPERLERERKAKELWRKNNPEKQKAAIDAWRALNSHKEAAKAQKYRAKKLKATPSWLNNIHHMQIEWFYAAASMMTKTTGIKYEVDHIHPLQGKDFTGLHVPWNMQIIEKRKNQSKGNRILQI